MLERWSPERCPAAYSGVPGMGRQIKHANWMIHEMLRRMDAGEDRPGQADRWIGFIQAVLWGNGLHTIEEMKGHNLADPA